MFEDRYLPATGNGFTMTETTTELSFEGSNNIFTDPIDPSNCPDVDGDGYNDLFIFITYSTERINLLQYCSAAQGASMEVSNGQKGRKKSGYRGVAR